LLLELPLDALVGKVVFERSCLLSQILEVGKNLGAQPRLAVGAKAGQPIGRPDRVAADFARNVRIGNSLSRLVGAIGLAQQQGTNRLLEANLLLALPARQQRLSARDRARLAVGKAARNPRASSQVRGGCRGALRFGIEQSLLLSGCQVRAQLLNEQQKGIGIQPRAISIAPFDTAARFQHLAQKLQPLMLAPRPLARLRDGLQNAVGAQFGQIGSDRLFEIPKQPFPGEQVPALLAQPRRAFVLALAPRLAAAF